MQQGDLNKKVTVGLIEYNATVHTFPGVQWTLQLLILDMSKKDI